MAAGMDCIEVRHVRSCNAHSGGRCGCSPSYRVAVWDPKLRKLHKKTLQVLAEAKTWRDDVRVAIRKGTVRAPVRTTVGDAANTLVAGMKDGSILDRTGKPYKPSTYREYERSARMYVIPQLGHLALSDVRRSDVQDYVEFLRAQGLSPSTVHNKLDPLRVIFRRAVRRDELAVDPTDGLELPSVRGQRDRIEAPERADELIAALPDRERAFWACAFYAGLRRGELRAMTWENVDLEHNVLRVEWGWDDVEGRIETKSRSGRRVVPLAGKLRRALVAHKLLTGRDGEDLVFGRTASEPFYASTIRARALKAWEATELAPLTPHEARHCAVSYFIAAKMNPKQISVYIGHGDVRQTWNRYGHLMPGDEQKAAEQLDDFLEPGKGAGA